MWKILSKVFSFASANKLILITSGLVISLLTVQHIRIKSKSTKIQAQKLEIKRQEHLNDICAEANEFNQIQLDKLIEINLEITKQFQDAKQANHQEIKNLKSYEKKQDEKITKLLSRLKSDSCSNSIINDSNNKLLKEAIDQN